MWQAPNQRVRAIANAKKRERERARRPIHIKRVNAHLAVLNPSGEAPTTKVDVRVILNDLSPKGLGLFSPIPLIPGQDISLSIQDPIKIDLQARVVWCQEHDANSHVLSDQPYSYRLGIEFTTDDQSSIKSFCDELGKNFLYSSKVT